MSLCLHPTIETQSVGRSGDEHTDLGRSAAYSADRNKHLRNTSRSGADNTSGDARITQAATSKGVLSGSMERIDVTSGRPPSVDRPEGSKSVLLTFDGLRNANIRDRDTRI